MKRFSKLACLMLLTNLSPVTASEKVEFYIAPNGSDESVGSVDKPFATLEHARDAVRKLRKTKAGDVTVLIRGGVYKLEETVVFGMEDSGGANSATTYKAYPGEKPIFSSGREIKDFKELKEEPAELSAKAAGKVWVADVKGSFRTLYDDQGMLPRARSEAFFPLEGSKRNLLRFPEGKIKNVSNVTDLEIVTRPHHAWIVNILPVTSVDEKKGIAHTSVDSTYVMNKLHFLKTTPNCWVENALQDLDEPGEWALNTKEGKLYIWPREPVQNAPIVAPQLLELIRVEGEIDIEGPKDKPVQNLHFEGLTFKHGERYVIADDDAGIQHDWDFVDKDNALVRLRGTENCSVKDCHFLHSGSGAIRVDLHGIGNTISGNHIEHMGGAGISLCGYGPGTKDVNRKNFVSNNHVHHVGEIYWHSPGILIWQSGENQVSNNLIHHTNYTSLIVSGCMTEFFRKKGRELGRSIRRHEVGDLPKQATIDDVRPFLHTHDNMIELNEIHHAMQKLGDGNAIYIRGAGAGNIIRRNYIHHLVTPMIMQCAMRTDGGQMDTLFAENVIYKCTSQGIMLKLNTRCENNFIVDVIKPPRGYYISVREGPLTGATIQRNILYSSDTVEDFINELKAKNKDASEDRRGRGIARSADADTYFNIYFAAGDINSGKEMLAKQQADGVDANSKAVDPMFVDPENGDFSFKPGSPALKMGIVPIDVSKAGLLKKAK